MGRTSVSAIEPSRECIGDGKVSGGGAGAGGGRRRGAVYADGRLDTSVVILRGRGGDWVGGILVIVGCVFGVLGGIVQVRGGGELGEGGEGAFDGEVWL